MSKIKSVPKNSARPAEHGCPDPDVDRSPGDDLISARRALCSMLRFWRHCGHKPCRRAKFCAHPSNECFGRFWPHVPEPIKLGIRAGIEAQVAGLPEPAVAAAIERAHARWREMSAPPGTNGSAPQAPEVAAAPPSRVDAPARAFPRARVL